MIEQIEVLKLEIAKLELQPGDVLIARLPTGSRETPQEILEVLIKVLPEGASVAVFKGDIEFIRARGTMSHNVEEESE